MMPVSFDEAGLIRKLDELPRASRVAFAAACAERLLPAYATFSELAGRGDAPALREMLDLAWSGVLGERLEQPELGDARDRCEALVPGEEEEPWHEEQPYADDAAAAVAFTLGALQGGAAQESAWAARRAYEALDHHVTHRLGLDDEERILKHPLIQTELARQRRDLDELRSAGQNPGSAIVLVRDRAKAESSTVFDGSE